MEQLKKEGLTRSIGVSNYREEDLLEMEPNWEIPPAVNQVYHVLCLSRKTPMLMNDEKIELHPYVYHADNVQRLLVFQQKHNIAVQAYAPLSPIVRDQGGPVDPIVERIAAERGVSASQVLLAWAARYSHGCVVTYVLPSLLARWIRYRDSGLLTL
jgi:diketogulonate reductase-like aldo/keto reductase